MTDYLLIVTDDGYGKRIPTTEVRRLKHLGGSGSFVSKDPVAVAKVVGDDPTAELLLASKKGKLVRIAVGDVPIRRAGGQRRDQAKGARLMQLEPGDQIAAVVPILDVDGG